MLRFPDGFFVLRGFFFFANNSEKKQNKVLDKSVTFVRLDTWNFSVVYFFREELPFDDRANSL